MKPQESFSFSILEKLVSFNTVNDPSKKVFPDKEIITFVEDLLKGWTNDFVIKKFETEHYTSIYFAPTLNAPVELLFMGHLDVVPVSSGWESDPFQVKLDSGKAFGRGTKDCKGSVVSALLMFKKLFEERNPVVNCLGLFLSLDEESGGRYGAEKFFSWLKEMKIQPKNVINVDGGPHVVYKRRAGFGIRLSIPSKLDQVQGKRMEITFKSRILVDDNRHSAYFVKGVDTHAVLYLSKYLHINKSVKVTNINGSWVKGNVIPDEICVEMVEPSMEGDSENAEYDENLTNILRILRSLILVHVPTRFPSEFGITVNPNIISYSKEEGTNIYLDVRAFLTSEDKEKLIDAFKSRLGDLKKVTEVDCPGTSGFFHTDLSTKLVITASRVLEKYSLKSQPCEQEGASDARYAGEIPVIDLGPQGGRVHGSNEYIVLDSMIKFSEIYRDIVMILCSN
ncbi:MAG: M20/M25/M40 family metallo-hydrolase [Candidatus Hodarchaeales archaeon]